MFMTHIFYWKLKSTCKARTQSTHTQKKLCTCVLKVYVTYDWIHEIDQSSHFFPTGSKKETVIHTQVCNILLVFYYPMCITFIPNNFFNFQKIIFLLIPLHPSRGPTTGLFVNVWPHIHHTADMEKGGMSAILCNRSLWSHFCSSKIYMRSSRTLLKCIWRFSTLQRRYLTFGDISLHVRWRWNMWFSKNSFLGSKTSR